MTINEALLTIIQQNRKTVELFTNFVENDKISNNELEEAIKANLDSINKINTKLNNFFGNISIADNSLEFIKPSLIDKKYNTGSNIHDVAPYLATLGTNYKSLCALATTVKTFIESTDTVDDTINTWREIEIFLEGIKDTDSLLTIINDLSTEINKVNDNLTEDIELLRQDTEQDIQEINNKIDNLKLKDVDNKTIKKDENGIISIKIENVELGSPDTNVSLQASPIKVKSTIRNNGLNTDVFYKTYIGNRDINENATNLVQERALAKHLKEVNSEINDAKGQLLVLTTNAKIAISVSPNTIYKGTDNNIRATATFSSTDADLIPDSIKITGKDNTDTQENIKSVSITETINTTSNTIGYSVICMVKGVKLTANANLNARWPIYYGFGENANDIIETGTKLAPTTTASRTYSGTNDKGKDCNFFILVPGDINAPIKFSMGGAPANFTTTSESINSVAYKVIKSGGIYENGAKVEITAS